MVWKWQAAACKLGSNKFVITDSVQRLQPFNTTPYLSACDWIVCLWFSCATVMILSPYTLELSRFGSWSVRIFKYLSVLTWMGRYMSPVLSTTCGAFRIQSLYILLSLTLQCEFNGILIHTARYVFVGITIFNHHHFPAVVLWITWQCHPMQTRTQWNGTHPCCKSLERDL